MANITASNSTLNFFAFLVIIFCTTLFAHLAAKNHRLLYFYFLLQIMFIWSVASPILCLMSFQYIEHPQLKRGRKKCAKYSGSAPIWKEERKKCKEYSGPSASIWKEEKSLTNIQVQHPSLARPVLSDLQKARRFLSTVLPIVRLESHNYGNSVKRTSISKPLTPSHSFMFSRLKVG